MRKSWIGWILMAGAAAGWAQWGPVYGQYFTDKAFRIDLYQVGDAKEEKGLYRAQMYCLMISSPKDEFCAVCQKAIRDMIDFTAGGKSPRPQ